MAPRQRPHGGRHGEDSFVEGGGGGDSSSSVRSSLRDGGVGGEDSKQLSSPSPFPPPPTLNQTESDIARDRHDYFNLVALAAMVFTVGLNYDIWNDCTYTGNYFWTMWGAVAIYFVMDMVWVVRVPICVKSPHVIVKHHIAAMLYLVAPIAYPYLRWLMGVILSVEINTWFLICRRVVYKSNGSAKISPVLSYTVSALFYITWLVIRCYLYPRYMIIFLQMWMERYQQTGIVWHIEVIFMPVHFALCALNLKWSYDLFTPIIKRWLGTGPKQMVVQSGL